MRATRALTTMLLAGGLLLPFTAASLPTVTSLPRAPTHALTLTLAEGAEPVLEMRPFAPGVEGPVSECYVFSPVTVTCDGPEIPVANALKFTLAFDPEAASNTYVHIVEMVNKSAIFWFSCKANLTAWITLLIVDPDCKRLGYPVFNTMAGIRLDVNHLPAAGRVSIGGWLGKLEG